MRFDALARGLYAADASIYQIEPLGVVLPATAADVDAVMAVAREEGVPVLPRGAGTSQCGQSVARAIVIDTSRYLNRVLEVDTAARTAKVEPGLVLDRLNRELAPSGLLFPVDVATGSRATLGGMAGNNSGGARSLRYGIMADNVLEAEATLPDGTVAVFGPDGTARGAPELTAALRTIAQREAAELERRVPKVMRHVAGYNLHRILRPGASLAELLVGSEGTLAFIRSLKLKLSPLPVRRVLGVCWFPSLADALGNVSRLVELSPSAVELLDDAPLRLARQNDAFRPVVESVVPAQARSVLLTEFVGDDERVLQAALRQLSDAVREFGAGCGVTPVSSRDQQAAIWSVRREALSIVMSARGDRKPVSIVEDCAVPLDRLAEYAADVEDIFARHGTSGTWYAHASVGCLHVRPSLNLKDPSDLATLRSVAEEVHEVVKRLNGSHSGEHGDGILRSEFIEPLLGKRVAAAFRDVKRAFDPDNMMNPGKIVSPHRMDDRSLLRYGPRTKTPRRLPLAMDWSASGGFARAVEQCNNNGACRKMDPGVMCPSFRVTREEVDSTRGRANVLRLAMTGQLGAEGLHGSEVAAALALCVGCKACKRECPTGVDMARLKAEVLHVRRRERSSGRRGRGRRFGGRAAARARLFAELPRWAPAASRAVWLTNARNRSRTMGWAGERGLGIARRTPLPAWSNRPFADTGPLVDATPVPAAEAKDLFGEAANRPPVALFADTFNRYFEPRVLRSGVTVLQTLGYSVLSARPKSRSRHRRFRRPQRPLCCGRTYIAAGFLDKARAEVRRTLAALAPLAAEGVPVVGLEPSCLLTLRDEAPDLVPGEESRRVADSAWLLDEFLASQPAAQLASQARPAPTTASPATVHIHGHCHQKAAGTDDVTGKVLTGLAGLRCVSIPSSCCGMAGSFGYEIEHAGVSRAMAEITLLPAVRAVPGDEIVVANGFSCRAQIRLGSGREPRHAAEVLSDTLTARDQLIGSGQPSR